MNQLTILAKKEMVQFVREFKVAWLPLVFIFLGITQPVVTYYLPSILEALGGGQGITIDSSMTAQHGSEVLASTLGSQFDQLGIMIMVLSMMGIVQSDKANGMLAFILTRPVTVGTYVSGKVLSTFLFIASSVTLGYIASYMYTYFLFTSIPFTDLMVTLLFYLLWVAFIVSFTTMVSTMFNSQGVIACISIVVLLGCRMIVGLNPNLDHLNPASMSKHAMEVLVSGTFNSSVIGSIVATLLLSALAIYISNMWISRRNKV
ncbi:ABC transporter permease subunit [Halalkalibacterium halodurans]|uniref:ABC transporter permease subunit n=1 Tax=Halalkalibacterium halodurans TaxID=86665 RepID=UPI002AA97A6F|nr:ABC transporter permease subunit [Halalkalibacterium halodurans]MDY7220799.1 ABC transporter permease subunit [Halalkalibacterium halodurans]MDY7240038.1 ABC transporter permease subunit [Halalkalibacterium halodurans]